MRWFLGDGAVSPGLLQGFFASTISKLYLPFGEVWVTDEPFGAALWAPPGRFPFSAREQIPTLRQVLTVFGRRPIRGLTGIHAIGAGHPHEPHWYLEYVGVGASGQGKGAGSALLAPRLERCDSEGVDAHLIAGSTRSKKLYERHGFVTTEEFNLPFKGPPLWRMWRDSPADGIVASEAPPSPGPPPG